MDAARWPTSGWVHVAFVWRQNVLSLIRYPPTLFMALWTELIWAHPQFPMLCTVVSKPILNVSFLKSESSHSLLPFYGDLLIPLYWKLSSPTISYNNFFTFNSPHQIVSLALSSTNTLRCFYLLLSLWGMTVPHFDLMPC